MDCILRLHYCPNFVTLNVSAFLTSGESERRLAKMWLYSCHIAADPLIARSRERRKHGWDILLMKIAVCVRNIVGICCGVGL